MFIHKILQWLMLPTHQASHILSRPLFHGIFKSDTTLSDNSDHEKKVWHKRIAVSLHLSNIPNSHIGQSPCSTN